MEGVRKLAVANACYSLGRRTLSAFLGLVKENKEAILRDFVRIVQDHFPRLVLDQVRERARRTVVAMAEIVSVGMVRRISNAVGSPALFATYERLLKQDPSPCVALINTSLHLDHTESFPDRPVMELAGGLVGNWHALSVLRCLVGQHFLLFPVDFRCKQRVCQALGISYKRVQAVDHARRLLPG